MNDMHFKNMLVLLSNERDEAIELNYQIMNTESAQIWANCIYAAKEDGLREANRFYNFPGQDRADIDYMIAKLEKTTKLLSSFHPDLDFPTLDRTNLQRSVNELHFNFAHSHHVTNKINDFNRDAWSDFNVLLHAIEVYIGNKISLEYTGLCASRIVFTWNSPNRLDIPDQCYDDFVIDYSFGTAYVNYCQVGRHFYEIFRAKDSQLADEHIQPYRYISANSMLYFGPSTGHAFAKSMYEQMGIWFSNNRERFDRLGFNWGDPKLAIGQIPVASLCEPLYSQKKISSFVTFLATFTKVSKVIVS